MATQHMYTHILQNYTNDFQNSNQQKVILYQIFEKVKYIPI